MSLNQHDLISYQDPVEGTVEICPYMQTNHGHTCIRHITCLGFCRVENSNPNRSDPLRSLFGRMIMSMDKRYYNFNYTNEFGEPFSLAGRMDGITSP